MGATGIVVGAWKTIEGVIEADGEKILEGVFKTVKSTVTTVGSIVVMDVIEAIHNDDDHNDN